MKWKRCKLLLTLCQDLQYQETVHGELQEVDWDIWQLCHLDNSPSTSSHVFWTTSEQHRGQRCPGRSGTPGTDSTSWLPRTRWPRSPWPRPGPASWSRPWPAPATPSSPCWPPSRTWSSSGLGFCPQDLQLKYYYKMLLMRGKSALNHFSNQKPCVCGQGLESKINQVIYYYRLYLYLWSSPTKHSTFQNVFAFILTIETDRCTFLCPKCFFKH